MMRDNSRPVLQKAKAPKMRDDNSQQVDIQHANARNDDPRSTAAQTIRSLLQLAVVGLLIGVLLFQNVNLPVSVVGLFVVLLLWLIGRTSATPLLVAFQLVLFFREPHRPETADGLASGVFVVIVLGLLMFLGRDKTLKQLASRRVSDLVRSLFGAGPETPVVADAASVGSDAGSIRHEGVSPTSLIRHIASLVICVLVAQLLLTVFAIPGDAARGQQSLADAKETLASASPLLIALIATVILLSSLTWRHLTVEQASMYARSTLVGLMYSDIRMIVRQRITFRRRKQKPTPVVERLHRKKDGQNDASQNHDERKHRSFRLT